MDRRLGGDTTIRATEERAARGTADEEHFTVPLMDLHLQHKQELISIAHCLGISLEGIDGAGDDACTASPGGDVGGAALPQRPEDEALA